MYTVATRTMPPRSLLCLKRHVDGEDGVMAMGKEFVALLRNRPLSRPAPALSAGAEQRATFGREVRAALRRLGRRSLAAAVDGRPELTTDEHARRVGAVRFVEPVFREPPQLAPAEVPRGERGQQVRRKLVECGYDPEVAH